MSREIYINGRIMPFEEASISPDDRTVQFSESVYEVIRAYGGHLLEMGRHMRRLVASAEYIGVDMRSTVGELTAQSEELLRRSGLADALIYIQVTTGASPRAHLRPGGLAPTILATVTPTPPTPARWIKEGISVITVPDERWARCHVKT